MDGIGDWVEFVGVAGGALTVVAGIVWTVTRWSIRFIRLLPVSDRLHELFGESPVDELHRLIGKSVSHVGELEIRQRIVERNLAIGVYVCKPTGECSWANDFLCDEFGLDSTEMRGFGWLASVNPTDRDRVHTVWMNAVNHKLPYRDTYTVVPHDGSDSWSAMTEAWPVVDGERIVCYVGYVTKNET